MIQPWQRKSLAHLRAEASAQGFRRNLSTLDLCLLGIGVVVGTGIFVLTGEVAAHNAGPAVLVSLVVAAVAAALGALCFAEMAALIPAAGSVYTYCFAALGEAAAFLIGWDLLMEFTLGAATVAVGWSSYAAALCERLTGVAWPAALGQAPLCWRPAAQALAPSGAWVNLPAVAVVLLSTALVARGGQGSAWLNRALVAIKLLALVAFIAVAARHVRPALWRPLLPANTGPFGSFGLSGVMQGAAVLFFSYCGVEALSNAAAEAKDPQRGIPQAIVVTMVVCLVLYLAVAGVMTGCVPYARLGVTDPMALVSRQIGEPALETVVCVAALAGLTSVLMVQLFCQPRVLFAMATDGLLPGALAELHPRRRTPTLGTWGTGGLAAVIAGLLPAEVLGEMCAVATLVAFVAVGVGVWRLRVLAPTATRPFRLPGPRWAVPGLTVVGALTLIGAARPVTQMALAGWLAAGAGFYLLWGRRRPGPTGERPARAGTGPRSSSERG